MRMKTRRCLHSTWTEHMHQAGLGTEHHRLDEDISLPYSTQALESTHTRTRQLELDRGPEPRERRKQGCDMAGMTCSLSLPVFSRAWASACTGTMRSRR
jgi:hypothetical protein